MLSGASCMEFKLFSKMIMVLLSPFLKDLSAWVGVYILLENDFFNSSLLTIHPFYNILLETSCSLLAILKHLHNRYFIRDTLFLLIYLYHQNVHPHFFAFPFLHFLQLQPGSQFLTVAQLTPTTSR